MRAFGIDCGTEFTGYGVVEMNHAARAPRLIHVASGTIRLNKKEKTPLTPRAGLRRAGRADDAARAGLRSD